MQLVFFPSNSVTDLDYIIEFDANHFTHMQHTLVFLLLKWVLISDICSQSITAGADDCIISFYVEFFIPFIWWCWPGSIAILNTFDNATK
jgi:hypothetical protein